MSDIVDRLRNFAVWNNRHSHYEPVQLTKDAADEIERLRDRCEAYKGQVEAGATEIARLRAQIERTTANMYLRDDFLVSKGLWSDFISSLPSTDARAKDGDQ